MFFQRPSRNETEDDLLREQEKFMALRKENKIEPSVTKVFKPNAAQNEPLKPNLVEHLNDFPIIEKDFSSIKEIEMPKPSNVAFPKLTRRKMTTFSKRGKDQMYEADNDERIKNMSKEEIGQAKEEIMSHLSQKSIEFLIKRGKEKQKFASVDSAKNKDRVEEINHIKSKEKQENELPSNPDDLPISLHTVKQHQWLNMDILEEEKLAWMRPIVKREQRSNTARFSFNGTLVMDDVSWREGLHHHSEEPEKGGYSVSEIFTFIQSSLSSQKIIGLKTLAQIMQKAHQGYYDQCLSSSLAQEILERSEILLIIRICLDEKCETVIKEALECLHNLVCNTVIDEAILDQLFVLSYSHRLCYSLEPKLKEKDLKLEELTDQQLIKYDVILALLRCNILLRIRFLIQDNLQIKSELKSLNYIFNILIRIARHSSKSIQAIIDCPHLLQIIVDNFLSSKVSSSSFCLDPHPQALKLFRLIFESNRDICLKILSMFPQIIDSLQVYLTIDPSNYQDNLNFRKDVLLLQVSIESLRAWSVLLSFNLPLVRDKFLELYSIIFRQLQYCLTLNTSSSKFDLNYAATLINCINLASNEDKNSLFGCKSLIQSLTFHFIQIISENESLVSFDISNIILAGIQYLINNHYNQLEMNENFLSKLFKSEKIMKKLSQALQKCSYLCQSKYNQNGCLRDSSSLPSFGSLYFGGPQIKLIELVEESSALPLFESILIYLEKLQDPSFISQLLNNQYLIEFIKVLNSIQPFTNDKIFQQIELQTLYRLSILSQISFASWLSYYHLSFKLVHSIAQNFKKEQLLNLIIFNPQLFERIFSQIRDASLIQLSSFQEIKEIFFKYSHFDSPLWIFDPIVECFKTKSSDESGIKLTLLFIYILINLNEPLMKQIIPHSIQFGLLSTIFIVEERAYMNDEIDKLLTYMLKYLIKHRLVISSSLQTLPHVSNFEALFKMLSCEYEFCSSPIFTNYLLVFLQQQSDPKFRKLFWSDHSSCLKYVHLQYKEAIVPIENLLFPIENDLSVIEIYLKNLLVGSISATNQNPFYFIAIHHTHLALFDAKYRDYSLNNDLFSKLLRSIEMSKNEGLKYHLKKFLDTDLVQYFPFALDLVEMYEQN